MTLVQSVCEKNVKYCLSHLNVIIIDHIIQTSINVVKNNMGP